MFSSWHFILKMLACNLPSCWFILSVISFVVVNSNEPKCGYQSCPVGKPDMINVHLICHTHDDVGWVKTVNEYYDGNGWVTVRKIIDSVVKELPKGPDRKFIYVETSFFWKWWQQQPEEKQYRVMELVRSGQLQFANGGWSMNDEGAVYYSDVIDQMTVGLRKLRELFGECGIPKVAWQIDPFGHSREQASLFAQMGFDGLFVGRIHYNDKDYRLGTKTMEFLWNASANLGPESQLFTGVLYDEYSAPKGFCFDAVCGVPPIYDDNSTYSNVEERISEFMKIVQNQSQFYATNNIMVTMGGDFTYVKAEKWFDNLDKLIYYTNKKQINGSKINLMYSTPACYLNALHESQQQWTVKTDDFFPYASARHSYWTGYFTSRPLLKRLVRKATNVFQTCRQLHFFKQEFSDKISNPDDLYPLKNALGIAQHHDAVSGTAKQYVTNDYVHRLLMGMYVCEDVIKNAYEMMIPLPNTKVSHCPNLDINQCDVSEYSKWFTVTLYNPLSRNVESIVRLPVQTTGYRIFGSHGDKIPSQLIIMPEERPFLPQYVRGAAPNELTFKAEIPATGYKTYFVSRSLDVTDDETDQNEREIDGGDIVLSNDKMQVVIDGTTGLLREVTDIENNMTVVVKQNFHYYQSIQHYEQSSGAYIFRPNGFRQVIVNSSRIIKIVKGPIVDEVHQVFNDWVSQIIRLPKNTNHIELEWTVGPIPINDTNWYSNDNGGKEVVSVFETNLDTQGEFYTDANGREMIKRKLNEPSMLKIETHEYVAGNYYPVNTRMFIQDEKKNAQVTLLTDRSVGGTSLENGSLEIMVHRRLLADDSKGVEEPLNELGPDKNGLIVRGKTLLLVDPIFKAARHHRQLAQELLFSPFASFTNESRSSWKKWLGTFENEFSGLQQLLPPNVHLLTLEVLTTPYILLRLEHFYEKNEDTQLSQPATVDLKDIFKHSLIVNVRETALGANQALDELKRFKWQNQDSSSQETSDQASDASITADFVIQLKPMQIRTFIVELEGTWTSSVRLGF